MKNENVSFDSVYVDNHLVMRLLVKHLTTLGHQRIGFISGPVQTVSRKAQTQRVQGKPGGGGTGI